MENLFSEDPQFRRVQYKKLSDNVREWQQEIAALVAERLPRDIGVDVTVVFQQVDDQKGYAVGTAIAAEQGTGKQVGIPIIVKSWHLAPIDLFFCEGKLYPLTEDNLAKIFYQNAVGSSVAPQKAPPQMVDDVYAEMRNPPLGGKYSYSAPFSFLRLISGTLGASDLRMFKEAALKDPNILGAYQRRGNFDLLCKFAQEKPKPDEQDDINKERAQTVLTIKKDAPDKYRLFSATDEVYDPVVISTNRRGALDMLNLMKAELVDFEKDPMLVADQNGFVTIKAPESPYGKDIDGPTGENQLGPRKNPMVFDPMQHDRTAKNIDSFGRYGVRDRDGVLAKGWVVPNVVNFDGSKASNKLFLGKALAAYQGRIAGIPLSDDATTHIVHDRPDAGKTGVLMYREGKDVFATVPFQVTAVTVYKNLRSLAIVDVNGKQINLIVSPSINGIVKIKDSAAAELGPLLGPGDNYFISAKMFFVRMPRLCPVSESPEEFKRIAAEWLDHNPIKVAMANGRYVFRGKALDRYRGITPGKHPSGFDKAAFDFGSLARHEAEFLLASWGLPLEKCAEVLDGVKTKIALDIHHLRLPKTPAQVKTAAPTRARAQIVRDMKPPIAELVKIAASIEDAQTVDSVLSLGFINPENVSRFTAARAMLWEVSHMLAKLLLASRLGMEDLPEESIRSAISHIQRVISGIDKLKMLESEESKTAAAKPSVPRHVGGRLVCDDVPVGFTR